MKIALAESEMQDKDVADQANVGRAWLGSVKQGQVKDPPIDKLRAVAKVLGKTTGYFTAPLGYVPIDEVENGLLVGLTDDDREILGRIASRMSVGAEAPVIVDDPPDDVHRPRRAVHS